MKLLALLLLTPALSFVAPNAPSIRNMAPVRAVNEPWTEKVSKAAGSAGLAFLIFTQPVLAGTSVVVSRP